jgi:glycosyltransferase involved in cell wall biosynthesis
MHAKAPEVLVEAMAIVRKAVPNAEALFVGGSNERNGMPYVEWIRKSYPNMEGCRFVGHTPSDEVIRYMSECRAVVVTSRYDSFNLAALEGIAAGRPVVVTSTAGIAEVLNKLSECAVVEPNDPQALAQALIPLLADASRAAAVGDAARDKVRPLLDPAAIAATRERLYYDAINSFRRGRKRN